jgi:hypothetical protein
MAITLTHGEFDSQVIHEPVIPRAEHMLTGAEINPAADKPDPFEFQTEPLFRRPIKAQLDGATGSDHTLPGQDMRGCYPKEPCDGPVMQRVSGGGCHLPVG